MKDLNQKKRQERIKKYQKECIIDMILEKKEIPEKLLKNIGVINFGKK
jgi:hypothetical protein